MTYLSCWTVVFPWETVRRLKTFSSLRGRLGGEEGGERLASEVPESELQEKKNIKQVALIGYDLLGMLYETCFKKKSFSLENFFFLSRLHSFLLLFLLCKLKRTLNN